MEKTRIRNMGKSRKERSTDISPKQIPKVETYRETEFSKEEKSCHIFLDEWVIIIILFGIVLTIYSTSLYPSLPGGDSGELIAAAHEFGVAHPPGYPLFTLLSKTFSKFITFGSIAWRMNLLAALLGSLAVGVLYLLIFRLTQQKGAAILGVGFFAFNRVTWLWSISAEVFSLNNLLLSLLIFTAVELSINDKEEKQKVCLFGSFLCGLCLSNQHTSILYLIFLIPWALLHLLQNKLIFFRTLVYITGAFLLGLLPYLYLPVSSFMHRARWTWGDHTHLQGFLRHLLRQEYGTWDLLKDHTGQGFVAGLRAYYTHLMTDLSWIIFGLFALSPFVVFFRRKSNIGGLLLTLFVMLLFYIFFFAWRANLDIKNPLFFKVVERFWMQSDLLLIVFASLSYSHFSDFLCKKMRMKLSYVDLALVFSLVAIQLNKSWQCCNQRNNTVIHDFSLQALNAFPKDSIILTKGDLCSNSFRYFHLCENVRPDLHIFDQEVLTYEWSLPMMREFYPGIQFPGDFLYLRSGVAKDGRKAFTFKDLIDANIVNHEIFACIGVQEHEPSWKTSYFLRPFGVCWELVKEDTPINVDKWSTEITSFTDKWPYNWTVDPDDGTWEYVANSEMWRAKTATALFFLEKALVLPEKTDLSRMLLLKSYELYTNAIKAAPVFPPYWHRNYAITCERVMREDTSLNQLHLIEKTVFHFKEFIRLEPNDPDVPKIRNAVKTLSDYLANIHTNVR